MSTVAHCWLAALLLDEIRFTIFLKNVLFSSASSKLIYDLLTPAGTCERCHRAVEPAPP
jgi:hypothetical protein